MRGARAIAIAAWGAGGVTLLLVQAVVRLGELALEPWLAGSMSLGQQALYLGWLGVNGYVEGYRAFQKRFCPRVVGRAFYLSRHPQPVHVLLAPLYSMGLFYASRRQLALSWGLIGAIVALVTIVRALPQPWRGIVDGVVVIGLVWGVGVIAFLFVRVLGGAPAPHPEGLPDTIAPELVADPAGE